MADGDFTIALVLSLPSPWPPPAGVVVLAGAAADGQQFKIVGYSDGHLETAVSPTPSAAPSARMHWQAIQVDGPNIFIFMLMKEDRQLRAWINGQELLTLADSGGLAFPIPERVLEREPLSFHHPDAAAACREAVDERADRFATRKKFSPRVASREKTLPEQQAELRQAVLALRSLQDAAATGAHHLLPAVASQLRGLIYWPPRTRDSPTWNPLLLRLASSTHTALAIYATQERGEESPGIIDAAAYSVQNLQASSIRRYPADSLMDLETYLAMPVLRVRTSDGDRRATVADVLAAAANSAGSAHYDETVPLYLDDLNAHVMLGRTLLQILTLGLAEVVSQLGEYLLGSADIV